MTHLHITTDSPDDFNSTPAFGGPVTARISNPDAENGAPTAGGCSWMNSAQVHVDPEADEVTLTVSVGDPRGGFVFTVRRLPDGRLLIHTPHPGESTPHVKTIQLHEGTLQAEGDFSDNYVACEDCCEVISLEEVSDIDAIGSVCSDCATAYDDPGFPSREVGQ